jgi:hypothetical protein
MLNSDFLSQFSFEKLSQQIEPLAIYSNPYDQFLFVKAVIAAVRAEMKSESGSDILRITTFDEIARYVKLVIAEHPGLDNSTALIVATTALRIELKKPQQGGFESDASTH